MKASSDSLPVIKYGSKPNILFVGNGLNRLFNQKSCDEIIESFVEQNTDISDYEKLSALPFTMKVVVATDDKVDESMKELTTKMASTVINEEQQSFLSGFLELPFEQIINANYTYEIEQAICAEYSLGENRRHSRCSTETKNSINELLYRYNYLKYKNKDKYIWHIHGQAYKSSSVIMGHYYYGKLLYQMQGYIPKMMRRWKVCQKKKIDYRPMSWIDYFILGEVYIVGFGMDYSEIDLWWLASCKKRNGKDSYIHFFTPECDILKDKEMLMKSYKIDVIKIKRNTYSEYYDEVLKQLKMLD